MKEFSIWNILMQWYIYVTNNYLCNILQLVITAKINTTNCTYYISIIVKVGIMIFLEIYFVNMSLASCNQAPFFIFSIFICQKFYIFFIIQLWVIMLVLGEEVIRVQI